MGGSILGSCWKEWLRRAGKLIYRALLWALYPLNLYLSRTRQKVKYPNSALHISYMVHIPYHATRLLRRFGVKADYLAIGESAVWEKCDFQKKPSRWPWVQAWREFMLFWQVVAKYEVVHLHFIIGLSESGWELPLLKRMGRKIVIHYRGCEIRDRDKNMTLHPEMNICQQCDYGSVCQSPAYKHRRELAKKYGDYFLVSTPDLKDFASEAEHFPFFAPEIDEGSVQPGRNREKGMFKIVHVTNHPGLEGTDQIRAAIERLKGKGYAIDFVFLRGVPPDRVLLEYRDADLAIGKMKMGYYANEQIESMALGVPIITYVRPEFMTPELSHSGFIFARLSNLEETLEHYLTHPEALEEKRRIARASILRVHDNEKLARRLIDLYERIKLPDPKDAILESGGMDGE